MNRSSVLVGMTTLAATTLAARADIIYSGPINASVTPSSSYTMSITEGGTTYSWTVGIVIGGPLHYSHFTPVTDATGVAVIAASPLDVFRFGFEEGIGAFDTFNFFPTSGTANSNLTMRDYAGNSGMFPPVGTSQYAGFAFGDAGNRFYGWASFDMVGPDLIVLNDFAYNNVAGESIGAGMLIPAPGAIALLGLGGLVGRRRRS